MTTKPFRLFDSYEYTLISQRIPRMKTKHMKPIDYLYVRFDDEEEDECHMIADDNGT